MKRILSISLLSAILLMGIWGCEKEYIPPANADFSDPVAGASGKNRIERGTSTTFADLSQGVSNRTWEIPSSAQIINLDGKDPSALDIVDVQFNEPGEMEVRLTSEFKDTSVSLDTTFTVMVLDYVEASVFVESVDASFFEIETNQVTLYEGGSITFSDSSAGAPNRRSWRFDGGDPKTAAGTTIAEDEAIQTISVQYPTIGVYDVQLVAWRQFPDGVADTIVLKDFVNVVENVDPPLAVGADEDENGVIHLAFDQEMIVGGDLIPNFSLMVDDTVAAISSITLNPQNLRIVDIKPEVDIEHYSRAFLSYDGNGDLTKLNGIKSADFSDLAISLNQPPNLLIMAGMDPSFESGSLDGWNPVLVAANANPETNNSGAGFELTNAAHDGNNAFVVHVNPNEDLDEAAGEKNNFRILTDLTTNPLQFEAGKTYRIEFWYKVEGEGLQEFTSRFHGEGWPPAPGGGWSPGGQTDWKFRQITWNAPNPEDLPNGKISIQFISKTNNKKADIYFDNMTVYSID